MTNQDVSRNKELASVLADGQLHGDAFALAVAAVGGSEEGMAAWHSYHLIGDVLRSAETSASHGDAAFLARFQVRLESEDARPVREPQTPRRVVGVPHTASDAHPVPARVGQQRSSANDANVRWKRLAGVASLVAVAAIGWQWVGMGVPTGKDGAAPAQLAAAQNTATPVAVPAPVLASDSEPQVMLRDPRLDELIAAHKQFGGTSALQMPAGFLRNATFENPGR